MTLPEMLTSLFFSLLTISILLTVIGIFRRLFYLPKGFINLAEDNDCTRVWILGNVIKVRSLPCLVLYVASTDYYYAGEAELNRNNKFDKCFYVHGFDLKENEEKQIRELRFVGVCFRFFGLIVKETVGRVAQVDSLKNGCFRVDIIFE